MSTLYSLDVKLDTRYSHTNMLRVLKAGKSLNFLYYQYMDPVVDLQRAVEIFLATDPDSGDRHINIVFQDTAFLLWFFEANDGLLEVSIGSFGSPWRDDFNHDIRMVHLARYIRLLLRLCKDFTVLELKTDDI